MFRVAHTANSIPGGELHGCGGGGGDGMSMRGKRQGEGR